MTKLLWDNNITVKVKLSSSFVTEVSLPKTVLLFAFEGYHSRESLAEQPCRPGGAESCGGDLRH